MRTVVVYKLSCVVNRKGVREGSAGLHLRVGVMRVGRGLPAATTAHTPRHARGSVEDEVAADAAASLSANLVIL